ncbi:MAG: hypothetical protein HN686_11540 [Bacteroidetes bacterium]|jgi:type I restriction enzyme, S subunit|nr:hypothetical protein [Bacteroidota bacterium]MBT6051691.1 hypothetical protein [Candidatus Scalindua sp.]MBT7464610.1 hypothetical protein [Bacteroidota bacterium]
MNDRNWISTRLGKEVQLHGGGAFPSKDSSEDGIRWLKIANVGINTTKWDVQDYLPDNYLELFPQFLLNSGDVVMALTRPILNNKLKIARLNEADVPSLLNQRVGKVITSKDNDISFIYYLLQSSEIVFRLQQAMAGTDPPNLGYSTFKKIPITLPPLPEQRKIAEILSTWDKAIKKLDQLIEKKKLLKKGLMQQLLTGKKRFPGYMKPWKEVRLGEIGELKNGINKDKEFFGEGSPFVNLQDVFGVSAITKIPKGLVKTSQADRINYGLKRGDVLFIRSSVKPTGVGLTAVVDFDLEEIVFSGFLIRFRIYPELIDFGFRRYCFSSDKCRNEVLRKSTVSANTNINQQSLMKVPLLLPCLEEQAKIAEVLSSCDYEIELIQNKRNIVFDQKKGLTQQLLTGKIRTVHE